MVIEWQPEAIEFIFSINHVAPQATAKIIANINASVERLATFPMIAAIEPLFSEYPETFR
jgi:hypothetical protein